MGTVFFTMCMVSDVDSMRPMSASLVTINIYTQQYTNTVSILGWRVGDLRPIYTGNGETVLCVKRSINLVF